VERSPGEAGRREGPFIQSKRGEKNVSNSILQGVDRNQDVGLTQNNDVG